MCYSITSTPLGDLKQGNGGRRSALKGDGRAEKSGILSLAPSASELACVGAVRGKNVQSSVSVRPVAGRAHCAKLADWHCQKHCTVACSAARTRAYVDRNGLTSCSHDSLYFARNGHGKKQTCTRFTAQRAPRPPRPPPRRGPRSPAHRYVQATCSTMYIACGMAPAPTPTLLRHTIDIAPTRTQGP